MEIKREICLAISEVLEGLKIADFKIILTSDNLHGDYSTNIPLVIFPKKKEKFKNPVDLADFIVNQLQKKLPNIDKIEVLKPGFINFWVSKNYLLERLDQIITLKDNFGKGNGLKNKKIMLEFADPNPFKEFHIGHLRNISLGESYARLMEFEGGEVFRVNYQGDVGMHVAKAIFGIQYSVFPGLDKRSGAGSIQSLEKKSLNEKIKILGESYALGSKAFEEDEKAKKEIQDLNIKIYQNDPSIREIWEKGRQWSLDHFEEIYKRLGTKYKRYYFESEVAQKGKEIVLSHLKDGIFEKHEGAIVFRGTDHTRVFVTSQDYATYEAKDLALAKIKFADFSYDQSIIITANEQEGYFRIVLEAMKKIFPQLASKTVHNSFGFVKLKDGKMSSRSGNIVAGEWLLNEAKKRIKEQFRNMDEKTLEMVAVGAVKYSMLKFSRTSDITFSFEESISLSGNSGPYLQYTFARTQSVLAKSQISPFGSLRTRNLKSQNLNPKLEDEELLILRLLIHFGEIVEEAEKNFAPNILCNYLFELSQKFNNFYQKVSILNPKVPIGFHLRGGNDAIKDFRLALTFAVGQVIKTGLYLLGIDAPEKM